MASYKRQKRPDKMRAFNAMYVFYIFGVSFSLWGDVYLILEENRISWLLTIVFAVCLLMIFADAAVFVFTKKEIIRGYIWGRRSVLPWSSVTSITKYGLLGVGREFPRYTIMYEMIYKGRVVRTSFDILPTPQIRKCLRLYYIGNISGETNRKKKTKKH